MRADHTNPKKFISPYKPIEARSALESACDLLARGEPLPPSLRAWMLGALRERLSDPSGDLDRLLGLRSRRGGRLHAFAGQPGRDADLRELARGRGFKYARELHALIVSHRIEPDPDLTQIEQRHRCPLPRSLSQVSRIVSTKADKDRRTTPDCNQSPSSLDKSSLGWLFKGH